MATHVLLFLILSDKPSLLTYRSVMFVIKSVDKMYRILFITSAWCHEQTRYMPTSVAVNLHSSVISTYKMYCY
ncbi:hypothetical protein F4775DRAFT_543824 [Biscogniauxia sp. FL1348]|nr:hypothetical protein F4775DRAFT_543824 [Biscogniauxia sp. FL1348]